MAPLRPAPERSQERDRGVEQCKLRATDPAICKLKVPGELMTGASAALWLLVPSSGRRSRDAARRHETGRTGGLVERFECIVP
jgi:hypothetical protein